MIAAGWRGMACSWLLGWLFAYSSHADPAPGQLLRDVSFSRSASESSYGEMARRLLSPADAANLARQLEAAHGTPESQPLNPAEEKFLVYVPPQRPERGYALLVFVPPWQQAWLPKYWESVLAQRGMIFVTAARSGNKESVMGRREPLALLAAHNLIRDYPVDPQRVFVGGFSGGARIALRLALGYPDVFSGALLNAGGDAVGDETAELPIPLPPRELLYQFQESSHLVYATGEHDTDHVADDLLSIRSLAGLCMFNVNQFQIPNLDHSVADAFSLARALDALFAAKPPDQQRLDRCRRAIDAELDTKFRTAETLIAAGRTAAAQRLLAQLDRKYGGLAAPRLRQLAPAH